MVATTPVWIVLLVIVGAVVGGVSAYAGYEYRGSPAASSSAAENETLSILGAGTLNAFFPTLATDVADENPGVQAPAATQTYEGSLDVTTAVTSLSAKADVAAVADFRLIPSLLEPTYASYEVVFGTTPEVLVYNASLSAFDGIDTANWGSVLASAVNTPGVAPFAVWNASTDPNGYNAIFSLMLQGMLYGSGASSVYNQFYSGSVGKFATPLSKVTIGEHESSAAALLEAGTVSSFITYRSYAVANHLANVTLNPIVGLVANNSTAFADYAEISTQILSSSGSLTTVDPAPVLFAATVPLDAPNPTLGAEFLHVLLSPQGEAVLSANGAFTPIFPAWTDNPKDVPAEVAPDVTTMPSWAASILA